MMPAVYPLAGLLAVIAIAVLAYATLHLRRVRRVGLLIPVVGGILYGGSKWEYNLGLSDAGSWRSNDTIHAQWTYQPIVADYVFKWEYRDGTITNSLGQILDPWHPLPDAIVSDSWAEATVPHSTNMYVSCWAEYVPPVHIVTNGVYHLSGVMRGMGDGTNKWITPGIRIRADENLLAPPSNCPPSPTSILNLTGDIK